MFQVCGEQILSEVFECELTVTVSLVAVGTCVLLVQVKM